MSELISKIEEIFTSEYSIDNYITFVKEIFDSVKIVTPVGFTKEYSNFSSHIEGFSHIGSYADENKKKISIFSVELKSGAFVENSRSTQRSYARKLIDAGNCDAALVAFYTKDDSKWRLSFVRLDYEMKFENGKFKSTENLTPAKRYSFLVGKDEPCHTAIDRFRGFIIDKNYNPTLDELEEAFSVEKVTNEFFKLYCEKFYQLMEHLEKNEDFVAESKRCGFTAEQFAKKLMGQIVFLYFLQKKGWLGVNVWAKTLTEKEYQKAFYAATGAHGRIVKEELPKIYLQQPDGSFKFNSKALDAMTEEDEKIVSSYMPRINTWGSGSRKFLRTIFDWSQKNKGHFYEEYLEPLFYDTLNKNRSNIYDYCPALHCRVPFLSGGLFEPIDGYDWKANNFDIPDEVFSNKDEKGERDADGILDIFDRYNFTMSEDEPMEREVAIDPEMLGKVFENLLEIKDRKSKGAFYTPREIVHYMCQESLINYLVRKTEIDEEDIRDFIVYGDFMRDEDTTKEKREGNGGMFISDSILKIDKDGKIVNSRLKEIDDALATVKVADPAVGSGAFPLGMVNEIVRARQNITAYMAIGMKAADKWMMYANDRSPYQLKYNTIKNCIYAVDIEPSAVDIAQLRLWLSIVIDDEINPNAQTELDGHKNPLPLPNLECNILCGNSLIDEFKGEKLIEESDIIGTATEEMQLNLNQPNFDLLLTKLIEEQDKLFRCDDPVKKETIKANIQAYKDKIILSKLSVSPEYVEAYKETAKMASKPFILWQLDFAKVFRDNGGFDIVIGNPPYVDSETMAKESPNFRTWCVTKYESAKGNWDLFVLFVELGYILSNMEGIVSFIIPNKIIAADYAKTIRALMKKNSIIELRDYSNVKVFKEASVYPVTFLSDKSKPVSSKKISVMESNTNIQFENIIRSDVFNKAEKWDCFFSSNAMAFKTIERIMNDCERLGDLASVNGAATVSEAYEIKELLTDTISYNSNMLKFINTGTIDRYVSLWDKGKTQYIKQAFYSPVISKESLRAKYPKRYVESISEKIIIGGMTKVLECVYDDGTSLAGKSTTIVYNSKVPIKYLLLLLNSELMSKFYSIYYNSLSLAGGFYRIGAPQIKELPIKLCTGKQFDDALKIVDKLILEYSEDLSVEADNLVYSIYGVSKDEL